MMEPVVYVIQGGDRGHMVLCWGVADAGPGRATASLGSAELDGELGEGAGKSLCCTPTR